VLTSAHRPLCLFFLPLLLLFFAFGARPLFPQFFRISAVPQFRSSAFPQFFRSSPLIPAPYPLPPGVPAPTTIAINPRACPSDFDLD
jgi:hypothetical protein